MGEKTKDPTSLSNGETVTLSHTSIVWEADFTRQNLHGYVVHTISLPKDCKQVVFDTRKLKITSITLVPEGAEEVAVGYAFLDEHAAFGKPLEVDLSSVELQSLFPKLKKQMEGTQESSEREIKLKVVYETGEGDDCSALQWLPVEQTKDKKHPFLFSQCQAIHARSLLPCLDYPAQKFTYDAKIVVPKECTALMSAIKKDTPTVELSALQLDVKDPEKKAVFEFDQPTSIPSYLLAICVGVLGSAKISPRCAVYCEPSFVDACAYEFEGTERFLNTAEAFLGPYEWGRYDLLILPPSFPYGGMENPCLTFVTPTLVAGDRSLISTVAHEIAHSWTGNLVTNESWDHFWLNEGFTRFCEHRIMAKYLQPDDKAAQKREFDFLAAKSMDILRATVDSLGQDSPFTCLNIDHAREGGIDPDDAFSSIPYEKGMSFLIYLESMVGGPDVFEPFLKEYIRTFRFKTVNSAVFREYFVSYFKDYFTKNTSEAAPDLGKIEWDRWFHEPGLPIVDIVLDKTLYDQAKQVGSDWVAEKYISKIALDKFVTDMVLIALDSVTATVKASGTVNCEQLDSLYQFTEKNNAEILFKWFILCIESGYEKLLETEKLPTFLANVGRMKFTRPLYRALKGKGGVFETLAMRTFKENKKNYHSICQKMVSRDLGLEE